MGRHTNGTDSPSAADLYLSLDDDALTGQCDVDIYRSRGPGGQKRNKTSSAVRLRHRPTGIMVIAADDRSQRVNRLRAVRRLREAIALNVRSPLRRNEYCKSELLSSCVTPAGQLRVNVRHRRYYGAVSELLDVLASAAGGVSETAERLGVTTAALVAFFRRDPKLWRAVNRLRRDAGHRALR